VIIDGTGRMRQTMTTASQVIGAEPALKVPSALAVPTLSGAKGLTPDEQSLEHIRSAFVSTVRSIPIVSHDSSVRRPRHGDVANQRIRRRIVGESSPRSFRTFATRTR